MNLLDKIIRTKKIRIRELKERIPVNLLKHSELYTRPVISLRKSLLLQESCGIIAEFKRKSPSKGIINMHADPVRISRGYVNAGASAISVLTDHEFFHGSNTDLVNTRKSVDCPVLRKDFILDEYQVIETKAIGADAVLLIAECLEKQKLKCLANLAKEIGLEVIIEIHSAEQLDKLNENIDIIGVNNRNLNDFTVDVKNSFELVLLIPHEYIKISESGINDPAIIPELKRAGYNGFLIGEFFMRTDNPPESCSSFIEKIKGFEQKTV